MTVDLVNNGHNVYFGGIAGCVKTFVARKIVEVLSRKKVHFACTCTTRIACTLYNECSARTIHSFPGIGQCCGSKEELLRNNLCNFDCVSRWRETDILFRKMCYLVMTQAYSEKEMPSSPNRSRTYDLPITSLDALPLSYRRLVGAKAIKLGSWDKHPAYC